MNKSNGWISLHRKILYSELWEYKRPKTEFEAWIYILLMADHGTYTHTIKYGNTGRNVTITTERGQLPRTLNLLSCDWIWTRAKVNRFLKKLQKTGKISIEVSNGINIITVLNYDKYQSINETECETECETVKDFTNADFVENAKQSAKQKSSRTTINKPLKQPLKNTPPLIIPPGKEKPTTPESLADRYGGRDVLDLLKSGEKTAGIINQDVIKELERIFNKYGRDGLIYLIQDINKDQDVTPDSWNRINFVSKAIDNRKKTLDEIRQGIRNRDGNFNKSTGENERKRPYGIESRFSIPLKFKGTDGMTVYVWYDPEPKKKNINGENIYDLFYEHSNSIFQKTEANLYKLINQATGQ